MRKWIAGIVICLASVAMGQPGELLPGWKTERGTWERTKDGFEGQGAILRTVDPTPPAFTLSGRFQVRTWTKCKQESVNIYFWRTGASFGSD